jgi:predicted nucleotidyltransferase
MSGPGTYRDEAIRTIRAHQYDLTEMGVTHAAIFGSVARGSDKPDSDVDVMIEVDPTKVRSIMDMGRIQSRLSSWLGRSVDVARRNGLRPHVAEDAERDAVHAF